MSILASFYKNIQHKFLLNVCNVESNKRLKLTCKARSYIVVISCNCTKLLNRNSPLNFDSKLSKMDINQKITEIIDLTLDDSNDKNSATATASAVSFNHPGDLHNPGGSGISELHRNRHSRSANGEESTVLNENQFQFQPSTGCFSTICGFGNIYPYGFNSGYGQFLPNTKFNFAQNVMNYNNSGVSFNSRQQSSDVRGANEQELIKQQRKQMEQFRKWLPISIDNSTTNGSYFTLLNYNVLAQDLVQENSYIYKHHNAKACMWETRWQNLYKEITSYNADIICLQEVQETHLKNYYKQFEKLGYVGIYKKRTGMRPDGCALYYKRTLFTLLENITVEFNQGIETLDRDNVAIIARFALKENLVSEFVVATTHLLYNPRRMDVRLVQTQVLLAEVERIAYNGGNENKYIPVIITGDFNSKPDSAVYALIVDGTLKYENLKNRTLVPRSNSTAWLTGKALVTPNLKITDKCQHYEIVKLREQGVKLTRNQELSLINLRHTRRRNSFENNFTADSNIFSTGTLSHPLNLLSAFKHVDKDYFEATTHQDEWITVDYIFYSGKYNNSTKNVAEGKLKLISNFRIPNTMELKQIKYIPNFVIGSDHLPLLSKFKLEY